MEKTKVFIPVYIFDKEAVGIVSIPTKNDCYVKEQEGYFHAADIFTIIDEEIKSWANKSDPEFGDLVLEQLKKKLESLNIK